MSKKLAWPGVEVYRQYVYDPNTLSWVAEQQASGGGGGGGSVTQGTSPWVVSFSAPQHVIVDSASSVGVTGPLTDTQLRASAVPVSLSTLPSGTNVIGHVIVDTAPTTAVTLATAPPLVASSAVIGHVIVDTAPSTVVTNANLDVALSTRLKPADTLTKVATVDTITNPVAVTLAVAPTTPVTGTFWQATQPVSLASIPALVASSAVIGHVIVDSGTVTANISGSISNTSFTVTQATGTNLHAVIDSGTVNVGTVTTLPAITFASPQHVINDASSAVIGHVITDATSVTTATLSAETTKVIGTVNVAASQTIGLAAGSQVIGHVIADSGSTTAITGNVTAVQATGSNLHVVVDTAPTTAITVAALPLPSNAAQETGGNLATISSTLSTLDTDLKATQPRSISNFPTSYPSTVATGSNIDLASLLALHQNTLTQILTDIRTELRVMNTVNSVGLNVRDDLDSLRADPYYTSLN